jgi:hypothetical protein
MPAAPDHSAATIPFYHLGMEKVIGSSPIMSTHHFHPCKQNEPSNPAVDAMVCFLFEREPSKYT